MQLLRSPSAPSSMRLRDPEVSSAVLLAGTAVVANSALSCSAVVHAAADSRLGFMLRYRSARCAVVGSSCSSLTSRSKGPKKFVMPFAGAKATPNIFGPLAGR